MGGGPGELQEEVSFKKEWEPNFPEDQIKTEVTDKLLSSIEDHLPGQIPLAKEGWTVLHSLTFPLETVIKGWHQVQ